MDIRKRGRRAGSKNFTQEFRERVVAQTNAPGCSIAEVARAHGLNANMVSQWRRRVAINGKASAPELLAVSLVEDCIAEAAAPADGVMSTPAGAPHRDIGQTCNSADIEIETGHQRMSIRGVSQALVGQLLREWLR